ncbi:vascular endothelial growth factor C isoform X1 [Tachysurus ichikawai]
MHFFGISVWFAFSALLCANLAFQSSQEYYDYEQEEGDDGMQTERCMCYYTTQAEQLVSHRWKGLYFISVLIPSHCIKAIVLHFHVTEREALS